MGSDAVATPWQSYTVRFLLGLAEARGLRDNPCLIFVDSQYWVMAPITDKMFCEPRIRNQLMLLQRTLFTYQTSLPNEPPQLGSQ